jgi:hypothetical protein
MPTEVMTDTCSENGRISYEITFAKSEHMTLFGGPVFRLECSWLLKEGVRGCRLNLVDSV